MTLSKTTHIRRYSNSPGEVLAVTSVEEVDQEIKRVQAALNRSYNPLTRFRLQRELGRWLGLRAVARRNVRGQRGATLLEVVTIGGLGTGAVLLLGLILWLLTGFTTGVVAEHANAYARDYSRQFHGWHNPAVSCAGEDTDHNQYVTCTVAEQAGAPSVQIECRANLLFEWSKTCRVPSMRGIQVSP